MNATAEQLDLYLRKADPTTARTVEQIVSLLMERFKTSQSLGAAPSSTSATTQGSYKMKTYRMGGFQPGFDRHKLGQLPDEF